MNKKETKFFFYGYRKKILRTIPKEKIIKITSSMKLFIYKKIDTMLSKNFVPSHVKETYKTKIYSVK